jgi:hypothetical protein
MRIEIGLLAVIIEVAISLEIRILVLQLKLLVGLVVRHLNLLHF